MTITPERAKLLLAFADAVRASTANLEVQITVKDPCEMLNFTFTQTHVMTGRVTTCIVQNGDTPLWPTEEQLREIAKMP